MSQGIGVRGPGAPKGVARSSKRPRKRVARGVRQAEALLSSAEVVERLRLDPEALAALRACCSLRPPRNATAIVSAIRTRLEWSQARPAAQVEHGGTVKIEVIDPYARPGRRDG